MRVIGGFNAHAGTKIGLRVTVNDGEGLVTYAGALKKYAGGGSTVVQNWSSNELSGGVSATLDAADGYDVIIVPVSKPDKHSKLDVELRADNPAYHDRQTIDVGDNVPFGYRIFIV